MSLFDLLDAAIDRSGRVRDPAAMRALYAEIQTLCRGAVRARVSWADDHLIGDATNTTILKALEHRASTFAEFEDAPNRDVRLRAWIQTVARNAAIDLLRTPKKYKPPEGSVPYDDVHSALDRAQARAFADDSVPTPDAPSLAQVRDKLASLAALTAQQLQPRYRATFADDCEDVFRIAFDEIPMRRIIAARGLDPDDKTQYDRVAKALFRVRERLSAAATAAHDDGRLAAEEHAMLQRIITHFLAKRSTGNP